MEVSRRESRGYICIYIYIYIYIHMYQCPKLRFYSVRPQGAHLLKLCARKFLPTPSLYVAIITT